MRLATPEDVLAAQGVTSNAGSLAIAGRALDSTTSTVENLLESVLTEGTVTDYFTPGLSSRIFLLSRRFVDTDSLVVRESLTTDPLLVSTDGSVIDPSLYFLDAEKGKITFREVLNTASHSLSATYDAGLAVDSSTKVVKSAPSWLTEAGIAAAVYSLNVLPSSQANRKEKNVTSAARAIHSVLYQKLAPYFRPRMGVDYPVRSVTDE